ncbi:MAG: hypothetical protein KF880_07000 [Ferruginibacter sp.]|nr:hypothetical protein [Ferruginibacter sp.]
MFKYIVIVVLFIPLFGLAQQKDYIILHQGDTIHGKYIQRNGINKFIRVRTDSGKIRIPSKDVKEFYWKNRKYWVYDDPCERGMSAYMVLVEGTVTYLHSGGYEDYCPDILIINNEMYPVIRRHHFSKEAWNLLSKCPAFVEKYETYFNTHKNKTIVWEWTYRKSRTKCLEMIRYFNSNCNQLFINKADIQESKK